MPALTASLDRFIDSVNSLPPAPHILPELLELLGQDDADSARIVDLITFDPALTADVLRLCNSARFSGDEPVQDLANAITRMGCTEIFRLVARVIGEGLLGAPQRGYGIGPGELWRHSAVTAVAGKVIAREIGANENLVFTAALLHDLGKLALNAALEKAYAKVVGQTEKAGHSFLEAEEAILGVNHAEVGGRLLERWKFPEPLVQAIRHHHDPLRAQPHEILATSVHIADLLAHLLGHGYGHHAYAIRAHPEALARLNLSERDIERLVLATQTALGDIPLLNESCRS